MIYCVIINLKLPLGVILSFLNYKLTKSILETKWVPQYLILFSFFICNIETTFHNRKNSKENLEIHDSWFYWKKMIKIKKLSGRHWKNNVDMNKALAADASRLLQLRRRSRSIIIFFVISSNALIHLVISYVAFKQHSRRRDLISLAVTAL